MCGEQNAEESQLHLLNCNFLLNHPELKSEIPTIKYDDIFNDIESQVKAVKVWKKIMNIRRIKLGLEK